MPGTIVGGSGLYFRHPNRYDEKVGSLFGEYYGIILSQNLADMALLHTCTLGDRFCHGVGYGG